MFNNKTQKGAKNKRFDTMPVMENERSVFQRNFTHKTTFNVGDLIPIMVDEVLPGDTHRIDIAAVARQSTLVAPTMDNAFLDTWTFFVPNRLLFEEFAQLMGENKDTEWFEKGKTYSMPAITPPRGGWDVGSIADYMGLPIDTDFGQILATPFRAYTLIWNEWFRDQNVQKPAHFVKDGAAVVGKKLSDGNSIMNAIYGGKPLPVNKYADVFTKATPSPQKAEDVLLPILGSANVIVDPNEQFGAAIGSLQDSSKPLGFVGPTPPDGDASFSFGELKGANSNSSISSIDSILNVRGLKADLTTASSTTIRDLRFAVAKQHLFEKDARGGTRYIEMLKSHFGVVSADKTLQRPELLGSTHDTLSQQQVAQTSSTDATSPQGNVAAMGHSGFRKDNYVNKSFTEHGVLITVAAVRTQQSYAQGINKMFSRFNRTDFYDPVFNGIGDQPILKKELYADGTDTDNEIFGFNEAWYAYKYKPDQVTGLMRPQANQTLAFWNYSNDFKNHPVLSDTFIRQGKDTMDRTLAIKSSNQPQIIMDVLFNIESPRPLPLYNVPGLEKL